MKTFLLSLIVCLSLQGHTQCLIEKNGMYYGFFRVTNFKEKICWLSEPFAYNIKDNKIENYNKMLECFKKKVAALGGNIEHDEDAFGSNIVIWLNNTYDPNADLASSSNWGLPSVNECIKWIKDEIRYKNGSGIKVNVISMYSDGTIDPTTL